jgi:hypothetical protein
MRGGTLEGLFFCGLRQRFVGRVVNWLIDGTSLADFGTNPSFLFMPFRSSDDVTGGKVEMSLMIERSGTIDRNWQRRGLWESEDELH